MMKRMCMEEVKLTKRPVEGRRLHKYCNKKVGIVNLGSQKKRAGYYHPAQMEIKPILILFWSTMTTNYFKVIKIIFGKLKN